VPDGCHEKTGFRDQTAYPATQGTNRGGTRSERVRDPQLRESLRQKTKRAGQRLPGAFTLGLG